DISVSIGFCMDLFGNVQGISDAGRGPDFSPYAALDVGFWRQEAFGLLLHVGQCFPATVLGSSLGLTDLSIQFRWDLTEHISIHGGYRVLRLHFKPADAPSSTEPPHGGLRGPILGLDVRF